jgi:ankyrin repeat protein
MWQHLSYHTIVKLTPTSPSIIHRSSYIMGNCLNNCIDTTSKIQSLELHRAISSNNFTLLKQLVDENQLDINFNARHRGTQHTGTPLHHATCHDNIDCFIYLLQHGARPDVLPGTHEGTLSMLHLAALYGSLNVLRYLVEEHRVKVNSTDSRTAMALASKHGKFELLQYLVEREGYH